MSPYQKIVKHVNYSHHPIRYRLRLIKTNSPFGQNTPKSFSVTFPIHIDYYIRYVFLKRSPFCLPKLLIRLLSTVYFFAIFFLPIFVFTFPFHRQFKDKSLIFNYYSRIRYFFFYVINIPFIIIVDSLWFIYLVAFFFSIVKLCGTHSKQIKNYSPLWYYSLNIKYIKI